MEPWRRLDTAAPDEARALLRRCCGSSRWVDAMLARRPFGGTAAVLDAALSIWNRLDEADWREAFAHHPRIGESSTATGTTGDTRDLSAREQRQVGDADASVREAIAEGNRAYEAKFGYIFIICATGRSAESMLAALRERLQHDAAVEIRVAAEEQARITALRLESLS